VPGWRRGMAILAPLPEGCRAARNRGEPGQMRRGRSGARHSGAALLVVGQAVEKVGERFGVHQAVLDGDVQERSVCNLRGEFGARGAGAQGIVQAAADGVGVFANLGLARPVRGLVGGKISLRGVNAEGKEMIERGVVRIEGEGALAEQIPVECFQMAEVEDQAVTFGDGASIESLGSDEGKERVRVFARVFEPAEEGPKGFEFHARGGHDFTCGGFGPILALRHGQLGQAGGLHLDAGGWGKVAHGPGWAAWRGGASPAWEERRRAAALHMGEGYS